MSTAKNYSLNQHPHTPIDDLLVKHLLREANPEEIRAVEAWLAAAPGNRDYYEQLQLIWEKSLLLTPSTLMETEDDAEQAWQVLRKRLNKPARPKPVISLPWATAAAAAVAGIIFFLTFFGWPGAQKMQTLSSNNSIVNDTLPDGTTVTLNKHSILTRSKKFAKRSVQLQGEAFFNVAHDKDHPFQLASNGITITVLGTSFDVRTDSASTAIIVETGQIRVTNNHDTILLSGGESITLTSNDRTFQKHPAPATIHKYYQPRIFNCRNTPLPELTKALQDAYNVHIIIADSSLNKYRITAVYRDEPLDHIITLVTKSLQITGTTNGDTIILKK